MDCAGGSLGTLRVPGGRRSGSAEVLESLKSPGAVLGVRARAALGLGIQVQARGVQRFKQLRRPVCYSSTHVHLALRGSRSQLCAHSLCDLGTSTTAGLSFHLRTVPPPVSDRPGRAHESQYSGQGNHRYYCSPNLILSVLITAL